MRTGQRVDFAVDAYPDEVFHGAVTQVRKAATTTQNVVTYETVIAIRNPNQELFPGMTADVSILVAERANAPEIPNAALRYTPPQDAAFEQVPPAKLEPHQQLVYAVDGTGRRLRPIVVKTGITDGVNTEALSGVTEGLALVTATLGASAPASAFAGPPGRTP